MSRDQKPGRIRVISGRQQPVANTAGGSKAGVPVATMGTPEAAAPAESAQKAGSRWGAALVFIGGCAVGGAGFVALSNGF